MELTSGAELRACEEISARSEGVIRAPVARRGDAGVAGSTSRRRNAARGDSGAPAVGPEIPSQALSAVGSTSYLPERSLRSRQDSPQVVFPLHRVETRNGESFIMDEWAVVSDGVVVATSDPAFGQAAAQQGAVLVRGASLVIQKPVHVMNERHVPEPGVMVNASGLPKPLRGDGEIVAARIEFALSGRAESVDILYSSAPIDDEAVGQLLRRRVAVSFLGDKRHRAAAYVVVKVTDSIVLLSAVSALPQCCCGTEETFCV
jgi:hypothetical protein